MYRQLYKHVIAIRRGLVLVVGLAGALTLPLFAQTAFAYQGQDKLPVEKLKDEAGLTQTAFTYQGQLQDSGLPAIGSYDLKVTLYTTQVAGDELGSIAHEGVYLINGLFSVKLDFGSIVSDGNESWLEIAVRPSGTTDPYTVLTPRQRLTPTPYAIHAQAESLSLIGVPVGFARPVEAEAIVTDKTGDVPESGAKTTGGQKAKSNDLLKDEERVGAKSDAALSALAKTKDCVPKFLDAAGNTTDSVICNPGSNVGIGTASPAQKLDVAGTGDRLGQADADAKGTVIIRDGSSDTGSDHRIALMLMKRVQFADTTDRRISMVFGSSGWGYQPRHFFGRITGGRKEAGGGGGFLAFHAGGDDSPDEPNHMTILYNGNVGIGTANPTYKLDVQDTAVPLRVKRSISGGAANYGLLALDVVPDAAANNYGGQIVFQGKDSAGNIEQVAGVGSILTDYTSGSEKGALVFATRNAGT